MNKVLAFSTHRGVLYIFAVLASLLLSFGISYHETVINTDAICYLLSAEAIETSNLQQAMHLCGQAKWPFYSLLIYILSQISHFSYLVSAYVLNGFFTLLTVTFFILIVKELGGSKRILWLAAATILLAHEFNSVREYIVRDHGFWAFYLISLFFLLRYFRQPKVIRALAFSASLLVATLFRIEGAVFLLALPFLSWFLVNYTFRQRVAFFFTLNSPLIFICMAIGAWLLLHPQQTLDKLGRVAEVTHQLQHGFAAMLTRYHTAKVALAEHVLVEDSTKDAGFVLWATLIVWYVIKVMGNLSWIYSVLAVYAYRCCRRFLSSSSLLVLAGYTAVSVIITLGFLAEHFFLTKRYLMALSLILMLGVPFALDDLIQKWHCARHRFFLSLAVFFIFISALGGIFDFGYSKSYIRKAGDWLAENVPANASLYTNDNLLMYYSKHFGATFFKVAEDNKQVERIAHGQWKQYDYVALRVNKNTEGHLMSILKEMDLIPTQEFVNKRGDRVKIYKIKS